MSEQKKECVNCPGSTDHDTASCPLMSNGNVRNENIISMRKKIKAQAEHIARLEFLIAEQRKVLASQQGEQCNTAQLVGDLLAVIHRDGGHYQDEHGIAKALIDAKDVVNQDRIDLSEWQHAAETADAGAKKLADYAVQLESKAASKHPEQAEGAQGELVDCRVCGGSEYSMEGGDCKACNGSGKIRKKARAALAQSSPAPEMIRDREVPVVAGYRHVARNVQGFASVCDKDYPPVVPLVEWNEPERLMTISQHDRMCLERWQYFRRKMQQMRDLMRGMRDRLNAAQARVAELELKLKLDTSDYAYDSDRSHMRSMAQQAADAIQVFIGHDSGANLRHRYGEKWWEPLDGLRDQLRAFVNGAPAAQAWQVPEWIACVDRMPPVNEDVLVSCEFCTNDWRIKVGGIDERSNWWVYGASWTPSHWQPLPAAPAQGGE